MKKILSWPKNMLVALIRRPRLLMTMGVLMACVLIWWGGPFVGLTDRKIRFVLVGGLLGIWLLFLMIERLRANRQANKIERHLRGQGQVQLEQTKREKIGEVEDVQRQFDEAISILKQSKLGGGYRSSSALYALPWYMIIGPPAVGKSTALEHSGLTFLNKQNGKTQKIHGIGGTRNCDFWFTSDGILLDTAGRFTVGAAKEDREEWKDFLGLLKKERKHQPINGVIIAYSLPDLLEKSPDAIEEEANTIRIRLEEIVSKLGVIIPVYMMFTKLDLVQGFAESFQHYSPNERNQVWGVTFPRHVESGLNPRELFEREFDGLFQRLQAHGVSGILKTGGTDRAKAFAFPYQWEMFKEPMGSFIEKVFQPSTLQDVPLFRGIYWTSGTQEGSPMDQLFNRLSNSIGMSLKEDPSEFQGESKSYFLKQIFTDVVFPDRSLVKPSSKSHQRKEFSRIVAAGCGLVGVGVSLAALISSFLANQVLLNQIETEARAVSVNRPINPDQEWGIFASEVQNMDALARRMEKIQNQDQSEFPLTLWGLYQGDRVYGFLESIFLEEFSRNFLILSKDGLERLINDQVSDEEIGSESKFNGLKAYLMLDNPEHVVPEFLHKQLFQGWTNFLKDSTGRPLLDLEGFQEGLGKILEFFSYNLASNPQKDIHLDEGLVSKVRRELVGDSLIRFLYHKVRVHAGKGLPEYTLDTALQDYNKEILIGTYPLPGVFTIAGKERWFGESLQAVLDDFKTDRWVLGDDGMSAVEIEEKINSRYFQDFKMEWLAFLDEVRVRPVTTYSNLEQLLEIYSGEESPVLRLLQQIAKQTGKLSQGIEGDSQGLFDQIKTTLQTHSPENEAMESSSWERSVISTFRPLHEFLLSDGESKDQIGSFSKYQTELKHLQETVLLFLRGEGAPEELIELAKGAIQEKKENDLTRPFFSSDRVLASLGSELKGKVEDLFLDPVYATIHLAFSRVGQSLNEEWESKIFNSCQQLVTGQYPFDPSGKSASLKEVKEFFSPKEGSLWGFYQKQLAPFVKEDEPTWTNRSWQNTISLSLSSEVLEHLHEAWKISKQGLFNISESQVEVPFEMSTPKIYASEDIFVPEVVLKIGEKDYPYKRTMPETIAVSWPGTQPSSGAGLDVYWIDRESVHDDNRIPSLIQEERKGDFGFFQLLELADVIEEKGKTELTATWNVKTSHGHPIRVEYHLRQQTAANPFAKEFFSRFHCVKNLIPL